MWTLKLLAVIMLVLLVFVGITESGRRRRRRRHSPPPCSPRTCQVSSWSTWSSCTHQCGTSGTQTRTRTKTVVEACGGSCPHVLSKTRSCNKNNCQNSGTPTSNGCSCLPGYNGTCCEIEEIVDGQWSQWTYLPCNVPCGEGQRNRTRTCTNPPPSGGGADCSGAGLETLDCNNGPCLGIISDAEFGFAMSTASLDSYSIFALMKQIINIIIDGYGALKIRFSVLVYGSIVTTRFTFDNTNFTQEDLVRAVNETDKTLGTTDLQKALEEAERLCRLTSRPNATKAFVVLGSGTGSAYRLQALLGGSLSPAELENFRNETLQILRQAENQLVNASTSHPRNMHMAKRTIPDFPNLQDLIQMLENIQRRLLG